MALSFAPPPPEPAAPAPPADGSDFDRILAEFEREVANAAQRPERPVERPQESHVVAHYGNGADGTPNYNWADLAAQRQKLADDEAAFAAKQTTFEENRRMAEQNASRARDDLDAAAAAVRNVDSAPVRPRRPRPEEIVAMTDNEHREFMRLVNLNTWGDLG